MRKTLSCVLLLLVLLLPSFALADMCQADIIISSKDNPCYAVYHEPYTNGVGWFYTFIIENPNYCAFTIDDVYLHTFLYDGNVCVERFKARHIWENPVLEKGMRYDWNGGFPRQDVFAVGMLITGHDENGNFGTFYHMIELCQEIRGYVE